MMRKTFPAQARLCSLAFCFSALASLTVAQPAIVDVDVQEVEDEVLQGDISSYGADTSGSNSFNQPTVSQTATSAADSQYMKPVHPIAEIPPNHPKRNASAQQPQSQGELFYQLQILQEEVMQLRGQFEQQQLELQRLKQQRLDDFVLMDKRMSTIEQAGATNTTMTPTRAGDNYTAGASTTLPSTAAQASSTVAMSSGSAESAYKAAYDLIKSRELDQAEIAFEQFLVDYPQSPLRANAYYWLGELYDRKGSLDKARAAFIQVLEQYPDSNKVPDALYKLGKVYHRLGNDEKALEYLEAVIARYGNTSRTSVRQAKDYLEKNFSGNG